MEDKAKWSPQQRILRGKVQKLNGKKTSIRLDKANDWETTSEVK